MSKDKPNKQQQKCIDNIRGKYLVLAGPGTGKTFTLIHRVQHMIETGIKADKILCLTFTDAAAAEMKSRFVKEVGKDALGTDVYTYHGFCNRIIQDYAEEFEVPETIKIVSDSMSRSFVKECIDEFQPKAYRTEKNDPYFYIKEIKDQIAQIKQHRLSKEQYFANLAHHPDWQPKLESMQVELAEKHQKGQTSIITLLKNIETQEKKVNKAIELWSLYEMYQDKMYKNHYFDFNDMISMVLDKFDKNPAFLSKIANHYEYILVDEYQDTNMSQNQIVFNLTKALKSQNVFVVGDDDQIIYSFQGAKLDTIEKYLEEFPDTQVICLKENRRSTQNILDVARQIATQDDRRLDINPKFSQYGIDKSLIGTNADLFNRNAKVRLTQFTDKEQEMNAIVNQIADIVKRRDFITTDKEKLPQIAILTKTNAELDEYAKMLRARGIPYEMKNGRSIFEIHAVCVLKLYLEALVDPDTYSYKLFQILMTPPFNFDARDLSKLRVQVMHDKNVIEALRKIDTSKLIVPEKLTQFLENYDYLQQYRTCESLKNTVLEIGTKTGIIQYYLNSHINEIENVAGLVKLLDEAESYATVFKTASLEEFVAYLNLLISSEIEVLTDKAPISLDGVQLLTYFTSKGREFEYVFMPALYEEKWEKSKMTSEKIPLNSRDYKTDDARRKEHLSDAIKIMFVGMTRAKYSLNLSFSNLVDGKNKKLSVLVDNIKESCDFTAIETYSEKEYWTMKSSELIQKPYDYAQDFKGLIDDYLRDREFAPTNVNGYLECPRKYLYQRILGFSGKDSNPNAASYGTAIHKACENLIDSAKKNKKYPTLSEFIGFFDTKFRTLPFTDYQQTQIHRERGHKALTKFYPIMTQTPITALDETEYQISSEIDKILFTGNIDRIDKNPDGTYNIYDYKTGKPKSKKEVCMGGDYEDYYMQMCLYKYAYQHITGKHVAETTFIFVEDPSKNLTLELTDEECQEAFNRFKNSIKQMADYKFDPSRKEEVCQYCPFKDFCNMEIV